MERVGNVLKVKSGDPWFWLEKSGVKPNTVRCMTDAEFDDAKTAEVIEVEYTGPEPGESFQRYITWFYDVTDIVKPREAEHVVVICWDDTIYEEY